jgi:hypothetical protein
MQDTDMSVGQYQLLTMPHSEVCDSLGVSGRTVLARCEEFGVRLFDPKTGSRILGAPLTHWEARVNVVPAPESALNYTSGFKVSGDPIWTPATGWLGGK